jgi:hypothetical protein
MRIRRELLRRGESRLQLGPGKGWGYVREPGTASWSGGTTGGGGGPRLCRAVESREHAGRGWGVVGPGLSLAWGASRYGPWGDSGWARAQHKFGLAHCMNCMIESPRPCQRRCDLHSPGWRIHREASRNSPLCLLPHKL